MENRIIERFLKRDPDLQLTALVADIQAIDFFMEELQERHDQIGIVFENECRLAASHTAEDSPALAGRAGDGQDLPDRRNQVARQPFLGDIVGRSSPKGPHGDVFTTVGCHQNHRDVRMLGPHLLDQLQAFHVGHDQVGEDHGRFLALDRFEPFLAGLGEDQLDVFSDWRS